MKQKYFYLTLTVILLLVIYGINRWDDYREKNLVVLLDSDKIENIYFKQRPLEDDSVDYNRQLTDDAAIHELIIFLSQYKVKKLGDRDFISKYPDEQFQFQLNYEDDRGTMPSLIERDVLLNDMYQYKITNGPIDYKWLEAFLKEKAEVM